MFNAQPTGTVISGEGGGGSGETDRHGGEGKGGRQGGTGERER